MFRTVMFGLVLATGIASQSTAASLDETYSSFWAFGDSLSDPGNLFAATGGTTPPSPPYFAGRFSNGPVWAESIAAEFTAAGLVSGNFAFGGATAVTNADAIPDLAQQTLIYAGTAAPVAGSRPLASVFFGANDVLDAVSTFGAQADAVAQVGAAAIAAANAVGAGIGTLAATGIRDFAVWNLPDIGRTPGLALFAPAGAAALASYAVSLFNAQLDTVIAGLGAVGLTVTEIDTFGLFNSVLSDPAAFGLTDTTLPCVFPNAQAAAAFGQPQICAPDVANQRLFFDSIHPNAIGHQAMAANFTATIAPIPLPATALLLAGALAGLALRRRARSGAA